MAVPAAFPLALLPTDCGLMVAADYGGEILRPAPARKLNGSRRRAETLHRIVEEGPIPAVHGVVRWRLVDLAQWIWGEFRVSISRQTLSRELCAMDFRKLSARPRHHAKDEAAATALKPPLVRGVAYAVSRTMATRRRSPIPALGK